MKERQFVEESEGEEFLHKETWRVVKRQFERPDDWKTGAMYDYLVAMVFASHTLEGYLNFIGEKILPDLWKRERDIEGALEGKLALILRECGLRDFDKGERPFATVAALMKLRNLIVHPKTYKPRSRKIYAEGKEPPLFPKTYLASLVSDEKALRARDDVKCIVDSIHAAAVAKFPTLRLGDDGLDGILGHHTHWAKLHE